MNGDIRKLGLKLKKKLGNFDVYAKRFETLLGNPAFKNYPAFKEMLDYFASENCKGCRTEAYALFADCGVRRWHQEKQVDYCFQCDEFPCSKTNFDEPPAESLGQAQRKNKADGNRSVLRKDQGFSKVYLNPGQGGRQLPVSPLQGQCNTVVGVRTLDLDPVPFPPRIISSELKG